MIQILDEVYLKNTKKVTLCFFMAVFTAIFLSLFSNSNIDRHTIIITAFSVVFLNFLIAVYGWFYFFYFLKSIKKECKNFSLKGLNPETKMKKYEIDATTSFFLTVVFYAFIFFIHNKHQNNYLTFLFILLVYQFGFLTSYNYSFILKHAYKSFHLPLCFFMMYFFNNSENSLVYALNEFLIFFKNNLTILPALLILSFCWSWANELAYSLAETQHQIKNQLNFYFG